MQAQIEPDRGLQEIPRSQRRPPPKPLGYFAERYAARDQALAEAYRAGGFSMQAIADYFGVARMTVSRAVRRYESVGTAG